MTVQTNAPNLALLAGAAVTRYLLIKADGTLQNGASTTRTHIGITQEDAASGAPVTVRMPHAGTGKVVSDVACAVGALLYYGPNGRVNTTATSNTAVGIALTAAAAQGSVIEMMPF